MGAGDFAFGPATATRMHLMPTRMAPKSPAYLILSMTLEDKMTKMTGALFVEE